MPRRSENNVQNQKRGVWPARSWGLVVSSLSDALRRQLPFLLLKKPMTSTSILSRVYWWPTAALFFFQIAAVWAFDAKPNQRTFPSRKSAMLQRFEFGFDRKHYSLDAQSNQGQGTGSRSGNSYQLRGISLDWVGSIVGSFTDQEDGFRFGDLVGCRLDQGPGKVESYYTEQSASGNGEVRKNNSTYYGRVDFSLGIQGAYRLKNGVDLGLRLYYELGQTFGTSKWMYDHTNKVISGWVEYGRWVGEMQYGGQWNLNSNVYPTSKFKASFRWYTHENRKFFLGCNYERFSSSTTRTWSTTGGDGVYAPPARTEYRIRQNGFQLVGGFMF